MIIVDAKNGSIIQTVAIGERPDACVLDVLNNKIFSSNGEGNITEISQNSTGEYVVMDTIISKVGARTMCINPENKHLYLPTACYGKRPLPTAENPKPRPTVLPNTFMILDFSNE